MPTFSRHDIDNFAYKAVDNLEEGTPLHASVVKLAVDNSMNPEQIKRLVEATNTSAFLRQFKSKSGNQRMVEFDVANPDKVINEALGSSSEQSAGPRISITISTGAPSEDMFEDIKDEYAPKVASLAEPMEKVSHVEAPKAPDKLSSYMKHKYKDSILTKVANCNYQAEDAAEAIASSFKGMYSRPKYASFELDSLSRHGNKALPALQMVRSRLGMSKLARKLSSAEEFFLADRHVVSEENSQLLQKVAHIVALSEEHRNLSKGLEHLNRVM